MLRFNFLVLLLLLLPSCANKVRDVSFFSKQLVFQFTVAGKLALNSENVCYYIIINAPAAAGTSLDPGTNGPRVNGPSLNASPLFLEGRLPFTGKIAGDIDSKWTDFYYLVGNPTGKGVMGRGRHLSNGSPEITQRNYPDSLWRKIDDSSFEVRIQFADLTSATATPKNLIFHMATSDNPDTGQGYVFDWWRSNIPFSIPVDNRSPFEDRDQNPQLILRQIPGKPLPQLPAGVNANDVNISAYRYQIIG